MKENRVFCGGCNKEITSLFVSLNWPFGWHSLGNFELPKHPEDGKQKYFCSDECFETFLLASPKEAIVCVPFEETMSDYKYAMGCGHCGKQEGNFIAVKGEYGSGLDTLNRPSYFCSVECIINELKREDK